MWCWTVASLYNNGGMKKWVFAWVWALLLPLLLTGQPRPEHQLLFNRLPSRWDEALPQGNAWLGALVWQKDSSLRLSVDRADLWDDRPMPEIDKLTYSWVAQQVANKSYGRVQELGDAPYERYPAPTKLPGAALEFSLNGLGAVLEARLDIATGIAAVAFSGGARFASFVHASQQTGYFQWTNLPPGKTPELIPPNYYTGTSGKTGNSVEGQGLERLGYAQGVVERTATSYRYTQPTWNGTFYQVFVEWTLENGCLTGAWTISNNRKAAIPGWDWGGALADHKSWWARFWAQSSVALPDPLLERQYYLELYKLGCVARSNTPAITLQAIWTADNGNLPPWKGDFHHDLNTQLSYWPAYSGNRLSEAASFTHWMWQCREAFRRYTQWYFQAPGLNVPGVTTITGKPMGGWIQYSMSPTVSAWLAQHFYWQWRYSMDRSFLRRRAYPWIKETAVFLEAIAKPGPDGKRRLPISSSPEYHNNSLEAWFSSMTNYDLALVKFAFRAAEETAAALGKIEEAQHWKTIGAQLPDYDANITGLTIAPGQDLDESHRHHAHLMAIHPLGLLNPGKEPDQTLIDNSMAHLDKMGTRQWTGYSFCWSACLYARAGMGDAAAADLKKFASNFVSPNSFHLNGDQQGGQYSSLTYRPFTLEGNLAFAQGIHEMLLQSHEGYVEVFPAIPAGWNQVSFQQLRAEGAFLVSARKENGVPTEVTIRAEKDGLLRIKLPFRTWVERGFSRESARTAPGGILEVTLKKGQEIGFVNGYE